MPILYIGIFGDLLQKNKGAEHEISSLLCALISTGPGPKIGRVEGKYDSLMKINNLSIEGVPCEPVGELATVERDPGEVGTGAVPRRQSAQ